MGEFPASGAIDPAFAAMQAKKFPLALPPGSVLAGRYVIRRVLGQGGFGITYEALDHKHQAPVAVKEYMPESSATRRQGSPFITPYSGDLAQQFEYGKQSFLEEAKVLAKFMGHPNIVGARSYFEENGTAYLVMEYVDGVSFKSYIKYRGNQIGWEEAMWVLRPIMEALAAVHKEGILHRDATPDNMYITTQGAVKLLDFGAARYSLGDRSRSLDVILKAGYAPKEQYMRRGRQGPWTDVYSVAASFYAAITGYLPPEALERMEEDSLVPISARGIRIPEQLENAIIKGLSVDREDRFQTMEEFLSAIEGVYRNEALTEGIRQRVLKMHKAEGTPQPLPGDLPPRTDWKPPAVSHTQQLHTDAREVHPQEASRPPQIPPQIPPHISQTAPAGIPQKKTKTGLILGICGIAAAILVVVLVLVFSGTKKDPSPSHMDVNPASSHASDFSQSNIPSYQTSTEETADSNESAADPLSLIQGMIYSDSHNREASLEQILGTVFENPSWVQEEPRSNGRPRARFSGQGFYRKSNTCVDFIFLFSLDESGTVYLDKLTIQDKGMDVESLYDALFEGASSYYHAIVSPDQGIAEIFLSKVTNQTLKNPMSLEEALFYLDLIDMQYETLSTPSGERTDIKFGQTRLSFLQNRYSPNAPQSQVLFLYLGPTQEAMDVPGVLHHYLGIGYPDPNAAPNDYLGGFPRSESMYAMDQTELQLRGWEIMAVNGLNFDGVDSLLNHFFSYFTWYDPIYDGDHIDDLYESMGSQALDHFINFTDIYDELGYQDWEDQWWSWFYS